MQRTVLRGLGSIVLSAVVVGLAGISAQGAVVNGSFEDHLVADANANAITFANDSWNEAGAGVGYNYNPAAGQFGNEETGANVAFFDTRFAPVTVYQTLTDTVDTSKTYELTFQVGRELGSVFSGYKVALNTANDGEVASILSTGAGPTPAEGHMVNVTLTYTPLPSHSGAFTIYLDNLTIGASQGVAFDNVTLNVVPEPASVALLGLGAGAMVMRRRRGA